MGWYLGTADPNKGVIFRWSNESGGVKMEKCFASTQYSTERYRPVIEITTADTASIPNGIYYIRSQVSGGPYLTTDASSLNNTNVYQQTDLTSGNAVNGMNQMWRVVHVQNGYYTVRPYHYTPAGLVSYIPGGGTVYDENAVIHHLGYVDTMDGANSTGLWRIVPLADGTYYLNLFGSNAYLGSVSTVAGNIRANDNYWTAEHMWTFEAVANPPRTVVFYNATTGVKEDMPVRELYSGESKSFASLNLSVSISTTTEYSILPSEYSWRSENSNIVGVNNILFQFYAAGIGRSTIYVTGSGIDGTDLNAGVCYFNSYQSGYYYIRNVASKKHVDVENQTMADGAIVHQWQYSGSPSARWRIVFYDDGYCTIHSSENENYCLAVQGDSTADYAAIVLRSGAYTNGMYWKISMTNSGKCRFTPKTSSGKSLALESPSGDITDNGLDLKQRIYTNDDDDSDEWVVSDVSYTLSIKSLYDEGYNVEYPDALTSVSDKTEIVIGIYSQLFDMRIESNEPTVFTSIADICKGNVTTENISNKCENESHTFYLSVNGEMIGYQCTDRDGYLYHYCAQNVYSETDVFIYWSGHELYLESAAGNEQSYRSGGTANGILINEENGGSELTLFHEFAHKVGAPDHYCELDSNDNCINAAYCDNITHIPMDGSGKEYRPKWCVMDNVEDNSNIWNDLTNRNIDSILCKGCKDDIYKYLAEESSLS